METVETITKIITAIQNSPLEFIRGDCRFVNLAPNEYPEDCINDDDFFNDYQPLITFENKSEFLGGIIIKKEMLMEGKTNFDNEKGPNMVLSLQNCIIFIKCPSGAGFPYLEEFGEFIAHMYVTN